MWKCSFLWLLKPIENLEKRLGCTLILHLLLPKEHAGIHAIIMKIWVISWGSLSRHTKKCNKSVLKGPLAIVLNTRKIKKPWTRENWPSFFHCKIGFYTSSNFIIHKLGVKRLPPMTIFPANHVPIALLMLESS